MQVATKANPVDVEGIWTEYSGVKLRIARSGNSKYLAAIDRVEAPHRKALSRGKLGTGKQIDNLCAAMAEGILTDWGPGMVDEDGKDLKYSVQRAVQVLRHNPELRDFVADYAAEFEERRLEEVAATAKK